MVSLLYWIITIILSIVLKSWTLFIVLAIIWIVWMLLRSAARNGIGTDSDDSWWFFDSIDSSDTDWFDGFGGGEFGGGGASSDWGDSDD